MLLNEGMFVECVWLISCGLVDYGVEVIRVELDVVMVSVCCCVLVSGRLVVCMLCDVVI